MSKRLALFLAACAVLCVSHLQADDVAALPGYNSVGTNVSVFGISPLTAAGSFDAGNSAYLILAKPDASKYYIISKATTNSVTVVDSNFSNAKSIASFQSASPCSGSPSPPPACTGAAITPDGTRLVVAAGTLHIFDTTKDQELVPGGVGTPAPLFDVALSLDGTKAYVLGVTSSGGSQLNIVDLASNTLEPTFKGIPGTATSVTVSRAGLVYVGTQNQIYELDPTSLQPTPAGIIGVTGLPGKLVFTPDGLHAVAGNLQPVNGFSVFLIDLLTHTYFPEAEGLNVVLDTILVANSKTIFAYSSSTQTLYQISLGSGDSFSIGPPSIAGAPSTFLDGVAISNELPFPGRTIAENLFVATGSILYEIDLVKQQLGPQKGLTEPLTTLEYLPATSTTGPPAGFVPYGDKQVLAPNAKSQPLVVQALDVNGKPLSGATITFSTNQGIVSPTSVITASNGIAFTTLTAPSSNASVSVTATSGKVQYQFTITVGTITGPTTGTLTIVAGQGQVLADSVNSGNPASGSPLTVQVNDLTGKPLSGVPVVFQVGSGASAGSIQAVTGGATSATKTVNTDANGFASVGYHTDAIAPLSPFIEATITAKAAGMAAVTFFETTYSSADANSTAPSVDPLTPQPGGPPLIGQAGTVIVNAFSARIAAPAGAVPNVSVHTCELIAADPASGLPPTCGTPPANSPVPFGTCADPNGPGSLSDSKGFVHCDLILNGIVGKSTITVQYGYFRFAQPVTLEITPGPPSIINPTLGNNQTGKPGSQLPVALVVQITDSFGNVLSNYSPVTWQVLPTGVPATLQQTSSGTDSTGRASTLVTLGSTVGTVNIQVTAGGASTTFSLTVASTAAAIQAVSGNNQQTFVSTAFPAPLLVKVVDNQGNGVPGAPVTFTLTSGSAAIATPTATTDATGVASTAVTAGATAGNISIVATSGSFTTTFTLTSGQVGPTNILFLNGTSFQLQNGCPAPGCVAPGEIVTVQGGGFANGVVGVVSGLTILGPLQTSLAGVSITFNGVAAPIFYVSNQNGVQSMTIQVPFETQLGSTTVVLNAAGGGSATFTIQTLPYAPGVFTNTYGNLTIAVAVRSDGSYVSPTNPAQRGETIYVFATGLGETSPAAATNTQGAGQLVTANVIVGLNNKGVPHTKVDYAPGLVGVYIVGVQVPLTTQAGPGQPFGLILVDSSGNKYFAQSTKIPIQ